MDNISESGVPEGHRRGRKSGKMSALVSLGFRRKTVLAELGI